jgi:hypothetical protein
MEFVGKGIVIMHEQEKIGIDCDGNELEEFMVVRTPFFPYINFEEELEFDPRQYSVIKGIDGKWYLISVWDWHKKVFINRYEGRPLDADVPIKIKPISEAEKYEIAYDCMNDLIIEDPIKYNPRLVKKFKKAVLNGNSEL